MEPIESATDKVPVSAHEIAMVSRVPRIRQLIDLTRLLLWESDFSVLRAKIRSVSMFYIYKYVNPIGLVG